jgi:glycine/D-amino acid oxidase-like deaminating enzyme
VQAIGPAEAIKIARLEYNTIKAVHAFARLHEIDCESATRDTVDIIYDQGQWDDAVRSIELMRKLMPEDLEGAAQYKFHSAEEAQDRFLCTGDEPLGAISYQAGSLSAYKFVIGLLKLCLGKGLNLQTNTPVTALQREADGEWKVETPRGSVMAKRVVLATNGYTGYLFQKLRSIIVPLRGQITAHRPGGSIPKEGLQTTYSFIYTNGYEYMISRPASSKYAGDIIMGGGLVKAPQEGLFEYGTTDDTTLNNTIHDYLVQTTPRYFGNNWGDDHPDGRIRRAWTGIMGEHFPSKHHKLALINVIGYSPDGFPFVGEIPNERGLFISASFQGHGMVLCFLCADALVKIMCGKDKDLDNWFPNIFGITEERMQKKFQGRLHTKTQDLKLKAQ